MTRTHRILALAAAFLAGGGVRASWAAAVSWDGGGGDGNWYSPTNWSNDLVPTAADTVTIDFAGTVTVDPSSPPVSFNGLTLGGTSAATLRLSTGVASGVGLTVADKGTLVLATTDQIRVNDLTLASGGLVVAATGPAASAGGVNLLVNFSATINAGSSVVASSAGYVGGLSGGCLGAAGSGTGGGAGGALLTQAGGAGGGHGGAGGNGGDGTTPAGGAANDASASPVLAGSGGGSGFTCAGGYDGGSGGGAVRLAVGNDLTLAGLIAADGRRGVDGDGAAADQGAGGGGAGGAVYVTVGGNMYGAGVIRAAGGAGGADGNGGDDPGGGGGGGRVAVLVAGYNGSTLAYSVGGGASGGGTALAGAAGTAYPQPGGVTDLAATIVSTGPAASSVSAALTWTAPAPGAAGALNNYDIRWATFPLSSMAFYNIAPFSTVRSTSLVAGVRQSTAVAGLDPAATWYFALTVSDLQSLRSNLSIGATVLSAARSYSSGSGNGLGLSVGDLDGDGDLDLAQTRFNGGLHRWQSDGSFGLSDGGLVAGTFNEARQVSLADFDRNGTLDAAVANTTGRAVQVLSNDGTGAFALAFSTGAGENYGVAWGDYNNDGLPDLAVANYNNNDDFVARNNGDGTFSTVTLTGTAGNSLAVAWADADLDGDLDLVIANDSGQNEVYARNNGNGTFSTFTLTGTAGNSYAVAWGDYDGDGDPDIAVGNGASDPLILRNDGAPTFTVTSLLSGFGSGVRSLAWGDYDGDGDLDLLAVYTGGVSAVFRNNGGGSFTKLPLPGTGGTSENGLWADLDGDRDLDVVVTTNSAFQLLTIRNDAPLSLSSPTAPSSGFTASWAEDSLGSSSGTLTLTWGAASDDTTSAADLLYRVRLGTSSGGSEYRRIPPPLAERGRSLLFADRVAAGSPGVKVSSVAKGVPYYWAVVAEDAGYLRGPSSTQQTADLTPPAAVTLSAAQDATVLTSSWAWAAVSFSAPGEDGASGNLQSGSVYDLRWSSAGAIDTLAKYAGAPYSQTFSAQGAAGGAVTLRVPVEPGKTWYFALTTKDQYGVRSALSNSPSAAALRMRERVDDRAPFTLLQGQTTGFLSVKLWYEGGAGTPSLNTLRVRKFGTLPDAAVNSVELWFDADADGAFATGSDIQIATTVFVSSQATLSPGTPEDIQTATRTYFVVASLKPAFLPVPGSSMSLRLDGEAYGVKGAGFEGVDFPALKFDGVDDRVTAAFNAAMDVGAGNQVTVEAWLRSTETARSNMAVVSRWGAGSGYRLWLNDAGCGAGVPAFFVGAAKLCAANGAGNVSVADGLWHHVAAVYSATVGQFYVDGVALATGTMIGTLNDNSNDLGVGGPNSTVGGSYLLGELDEVRVSGFARYPSELPPSRRSSASGAVFLYHFDGLQDDLTARDATTNNINGSIQGQAGGYARSTGTAVQDTGDVLFSSVTTLLPAAMFRNTSNVPVMKLQLWTGGDFVTLDQVVVTATGSANPSSVNQVKLYLDNGDGSFNSAADTALTTGQTFLNAKATFSLSGAGASQSIDASTKTYFLAWNMTGAASNGADMGVRVVSTADLTLSGSADSVSTLGFPLATSTAPILAAQALVSAEQSTGTWLSVSSAVFSASFGSGNINHIHWRWDESPATSVDGTETPAWNAGRTTVTATVDAQDWWFHARAFDAGDGAGSQADLGPFWVDRTPPSGASFQSLSSTGGVLAETQFNDLVQGVTIQLTVSDAASGLNLAGPAPLAAAGAAALWHFDEAGGPWSDSVSTGPNVLAAVGSPAVGPGRFAAGLLLDGASYAEKASAFGLPAGGAARTLEAWVKQTSTTGVQGALFYGSGACGGGVLLALSSGVVAAGDNCAMVTAGAALSTAVWHHVALAYDGAGSVSLYADGLLAGTGSLTLNTAPGPVRAGQSGSGAQGFRGLLDEARVSTRALSAAEIAAHASRGEPFSVSYSSDAGRSWEAVSSTVPAAGPYVSLTGGHGTTAAQTLTAVGLRFVVSTGTLTGSLGTNLVRFHYADAAGNLKVSGPFTVLVDTNAPVAVSTPSLPAAGTFVGTRPDFYWTAPSTGLVQGLGGQYFVQVSSGDSSFAAPNIVVSVSTPATVSDPELAKAVGSYISTFTLTEGATYWWRVRSRSSLGVFGPWGPSSAFVVDASSPALSTYLLYNSTAGVFDQSGALDLTAGVTAQMTVSDGLSGLGRPPVSAVPSGTVAYWRFSERDQTSPVDTAGGAVGTLTCSGSCAPARYGPTPFGAGLRLASNGYMSASNAAANFASSTSFTVSAWIRPTTLAPAAQAIAAVGVPLGAGGNWAFSVTNAGALSATNVTGGGAFSPSGIVAVGVWQHVAMVANGAKVWFYVNGAPRGTAAGYSNSGTATMPFTIGAGVNSGSVVSAHFNGEIDEVRLLNTALTPDQVAADYARDVPGTFAVEYSTTAGQLWNVVSATFAAAGQPWLSVTGADGSTGAETFQVRGLTLTQSTTSALGSSGTNLLKFLSSDRRGNFTTAGPFTILVDTVAAAAVSTPAFPTSGVFVSTRPDFVWSGPSTATSLGMGSAAAFLLEVDDTSDFSSPVIAVTTPVVASASASYVTQGAYISTFSLAGGTTYWWRVRARDYLGLLSAPLTTASFVTDFSSPTGSGFAAVSSTNGLMAEGVGISLAAGVTVQLTVADGGPAGLSLSHPDGVTEYGVMYTSQGALAVPLWTDGARGRALTMSGTPLTAMVRHQGRLWTANAGSAVHNFDGSAWGLSTTLPASPSALESFAGLLYAALTNGQVWSYDGVSWTQRATLPGGLRALKAYGGRLYAGDDAGRVWAYEPAADKWFVAYQSASAVIESLGVYGGRLFAGGNPNIYSFDGSGWSLSFTPSAAVNALLAYDNKLYAATNNSGIVYQFDGLAWTTSLDSSENSADSLAVHEGRLYAGTSQPSPGRLYAFDGRSWVVVRNFAATGDRVSAMAAFGGRLYEGYSLSSGDGAVDVSTPLPVALTGSEGATSAQTLSLVVPALAQSANGNSCNGSQACTATNMVRFSFSDRAGRVGQAGPFAVVVDSLLSQPTVYFPADGSAVRDAQPDFAWVESSTMANHGVQVSTAADFSALIVNTVTPNPYLTSPASLTNGTTYYWRVRGQSALGVQSAFSAPAVFRVDTVPPSTAAYAHRNSSGGVLSEGQFTNLALGATFELTVQDPVAGLALAPLGSQARLGAYSLEGAGATALDSSGRANHASLGTAALRTAAGWQGGGLSFSGATSGMTVSTAAVGSWSGLTAAVWAKPTLNNASNKTLVASKHFRLQADVLQGVVRYHLDASASGGCSATTAYAFPVGGWTHVAVVLDPAVSRNRLFVNGVTAASCSGNAALSDTAFTVGIDTVSGIGSPDAFAGGLDEARFFSAALSTAEVQAEMAGAPFAVFFSTTAGATWAAAASTGPAGPRLSFTASAGSTLAEVVKAVDLPLRESTNTVTCAQTSPCAATNQVQLVYADRAGSVRTMGPFAVIVDTSAPQPTLTSLTPASTDQLYATAAAADNLAGVKDYLFEASTSAAFAAPLSSSGFVAQTTWTFTGLVDASTYFVRVWSRDQILNVSTPSVSLATATFGTVFLTTASATPASALQNGLVAMATLRLATKTGSTSRLQGLTVRKTGTALDSDVTQVRLYAEVDGDGVYSAGDTLQAAAALSLNEAVLSLPGAGALLDVAASTFHVVFQMAPGAFTNRTVGLEISSATSVNLKHPGHAFGAFPVVAGPLSITDGANQLQLTPATLLPTAVQPGTDDIPVLELNAVTDVGTSVLSSVTVTMAGTMSPAKIRSINLWRDADPVDGVFDRNVDLRMTNDTDSFGVLSAATMSVTGFDASSRTVTTSPRRYYLTVSLASDAPQDDVFSLAIATTSDVTLQNPADTVVFVSTPVRSSTATVVLNNTMTAAFADESPASYTQGDRFAVFRVTMTVDQGTAQVNRFTVRLTGTGQGSDVAAVEVWRDATTDGQGLSPVLDVRVGSAPFAAGLAVVNVATQTLAVGATNVFFVVYRIDSAAAPGVTLGAKLNTGDIRAGNSGTTVAGAFPADSAVRPVAATVNHMAIVNAVKDVSPGALQQGQTHVAMLRLDTVSDKNDFSWLGLSVQRTGTAQDSDISAVNVFRDFDGNGLFDAAVDSRVTSGADVFSASTATLTLSQVQQVTRSTQTYFVTVGVAAAAVPGRTFGLKVSTASDFNLISPNTLSTATVLPIQTGLVPINQFQNTVTVTTASIVPGVGAEPGTTDVGLLSLTLKTDVSNANWTALRVDQAGTAADADVQRVRLYYDFNDVGTFDSSNLTNYSSVTYSTQTFGNNGAASVLLTFLNPQVLGPTPKRYFLTVDLSTGATPARTVVVRASTGAFFTVDAPNKVDPNASFLTPALTVNAPPVTMYVAGASSAPAAALQGTSNAAMLTLKVRTGAYNARWTQLRVTRTGSASDSDVSGVKLYKDADGDGVLSVVADSRLSTGVFSGGVCLLTFATQTVTASTQTFFVTYDFKTTASAGATAGARIAAAGDLKIETPDSVSTSGFPLQSAASTVTATTAGLFMTATNLAPGELKQAATDQVLLSLSLQTTQFALTWSALTVRSTGSAADSDVKAVSVWLDANLNGAVDVGTDTKLTSGLNAFLGGTAVLSLSVPQDIGTAQKRYLVTADVASFAEPGRTFAVLLPSTAAFSVSAPNFVVNSGFPAQSDANATLRKLEESLLVTPTDLVASGVNQGARQALARLDARATRNRVSWSALTVRQNGNLGASEIDEVGVWRDADGDGALSSGDLRVGTAAFSGSLAAVSFSSVQAVGVATVTYFLAAQPNINATIGADLRLSVQAADFTVASPDSVLSSSLPFTSGSDVVLDAKTPTQPVVTDDGSYSSDFEGLNFKWSSAVGTGTLAGALYAVGTTLGGTDVVNWTALSAAQTSVRVTGVPLLQATTYYVTVKAQSSFGQTSPLGRSDGILMDFQTPTKPSPSVTAGAGSLLITWAAVPGGPSGIVGYLVEYRTGASPQWFNAKTGAKTSVSALAVPGAVAVAAGSGAEEGSLRLTAVSTDTLVTGSSFQASGLPAGTLFVRVRSVTGSGVLSTASDPVKVQLGNLPKDGLSDASVYPNPFDSRKTSANIHVVLSAASELSVKVYSVFGRVIREMSFSGTAGSNVFSWDGADQDGRKVSKGMYIMVLQSGGAKATLKVGVIH